MASCKYSTRRRQQGSATDRLLPDEQIQVVEYTRGKVAVALSKCCADRERLPTSTTTGDDAVCLCQSVWTCFAKKRGLDSQVVRDPM
ncbi:hypothetical protein TrispH2_009020 [Trichoplax sp. H2]|nr:hypothetical protein TrispH2_009020 [Trichoplax sp. H2]|eukprot:RDD39205.1 hypothetical protein TrispH2_009020 [Trichoplax sp. H2]